MLVQILGAIQNIHRIGHSHGDLKSDSISACIDKEGKYRFSLIDLGMGSKIPDLCQLN